MLHQFGAYEIDIWEGPPPELVRDQLSESVKPGVDGVAHAFCGKWAPPFDRTFISMLATYDEAIQRSDDQRAMLGHPWGLLYNGVNYVTEFSHVYRPLEMEILEIKKIVRYIGPLKNLLYPTQIVTRWKLAPIAL